MTESRPEIRVCKDAAELARQAAELFASLAQERIHSRGIFTVALSGGSTPKALLSLLAEEPFRSRINWSKVHLFWGDERCVPPNHQDSNYRMTREAFLSKAPIPQENVHRMRGEEQATARAADEYADILKDFFKLEEGQLPRFDLVLLGMGDDGHTASLFPGTAALEEKEKLVMANYVEKLNSYRLTLTFPVINNAETIVFLVAGDNKAAALKEVIEGERAPSRLPSQSVQPVNGQLIWMIDEGAARLLIGQTRL